MDILSQCKTKKNKGQFRLNYNLNYPFSYLYHPNITSQVIFDKFINNNQENNNLENNDGEQENPNQENQDVQ